MNSSDFAFWLSGYVGDQALPPTQQQWERIRSNLAHATGVTNFNDRLPQLKKDPNRYLCVDVNPPKVESWSNV